MVINASPKDIFNYADDYVRFSSHMKKPSFVGGYISVSLDDGQGRRLGSHIRMSGKAFGISVFLEEVVTHYEPSFLRAWETVGTPRLLVIGFYRMGIEIKPENNSSLLKVYIDYDLPNKNACFGQLFGGFYARWCVRKIIKDIFSFLNINKKND